MIIPCKPSLHVNLGNSWLQGQVAGTGPVVCADIYGLVFMSAEVQINPSTCKMRRQQVGYEGNVFRRPVPSDQTRHLLDPTTALYKWALYAREQSVLHNL